MQQSGSLTQHTITPVVGRLVCRVIRKSPLLCVDGRKSFYFSVDSCGDDIRVLDDLAVYYFDKIELGKTYEITHLAPAKLELLNTELRMTAQSKVIPRRDSLQQDTSAFTRKLLSSVIQSDKEGQYFTVLVAVTRLLAPLGDVLFPDGRLTKRIDLEVRDESGTTMTLYLYGSNAEAYARQCGEDSCTILYLENVFLFHKRCYLAAVPATVMTINPCIQEALCLKSYLQWSRATSTPGTTPCAGCKRKREDDQSDENATPCKKIRADQSDEQSDSGDASEASSSDEIQPEENNPCVDTTYVLLLFVMLAAAGWHCV